MIKIYTYCFLILTIASPAYSQVANDDCNTALNLGILPLGNVTGAGCFSGVPNLYIHDSTDFATVNFPYPSSPLNCTGYISNVASPAKDMWYKFQVNCDFSFAVENSDTVHLSFWLGDTCSNLISIGCFTLPGLLPYSQTMTGFGGHTVYLQVSSNSISTDCQFAVCLAADIPVCFPIYDFSNQTSSLCADYDITITSCSSSGMNDGSISVNVLQGNPPFICSWNDGFVGLIRNNLMPGIYSYILTDSLGCVETDSVLVGVVSGLPGGTSFSSSPNVYYQYETGYLIFDNEFIVTIGQQIQHIDILNLSGKVLKKFTSMEQNKIYAELNDGIYMVRLHTVNRTYNMKIGIQH